MFIIHAAFSCVLHPSYGNGGTDDTGDRCSGWWHGGTAEEVKSCATPNRFWTVVVWPREDTRDKIAL